MRIQMLEGECWWGGIVDFGAQMPWTAESECTIDPTTMGSDQRSPLFLSNKGRCLWSEKPFVLRFCKGTLETDDQVNLEHCNGGLKEAHVCFPEAVSLMRGFLKFPSITRGSSLCITKIRSRFWSMHTLL